MSHAYTEMGDYNAAWIPPRALALQRANARSGKGNRYPTELQRFIFTWGRQKAIDL